MDSIVDAQRSDFVHAEEYGVYYSTDNAPVIVLTADEACTVVWNGRAYALTCSGRATSSGGDIVCVGNMKLFGTDTGEPFLIIYEQDASAIHYVIYEAATMCTYSVYPGVIPNDGIIAKDYYGEEILYYPVDRMSFHRYDGDEQVFSRGVVTQSMSVELNLADDDQIVNA